MKGNKLKWYFNVNSIYMKYLKQFRYKISKGVIHVVQDSTPFKIVY